MKNAVVLALFVLSLVGVAVTIDATVEERPVEQAFVQPDRDSDDLENRKRKKRDGGRGEEDEEELRLALTVLESAAPRSL